MGEVSGSSLSVADSSYITTFPLFIFMQDQLHFTALHNVMEDNAMQKTDSFPLHSHNDSSPPVPSTSSEPARNRPPTQDGKQTSQESARTKS